MNAILKSCFLMVIGSIIITSCNIFCDREQTFKVKENKVVENKIYKDIEDYYPDTILWKDKDSNYYDTVVFFRNYSKGDSSRRISFNFKYYDEQCESLIFDNGNIVQRNKILDQMNKFQFIYYEMESNDDLIVRLYITDKKSSKTFEDVRYLIRKHKIVGINILPCCTDRFVPYKEFINSTMP